MNDSPQKAPHNSVFLPKDVVDNIYDAQDYMPAYREHMDRWVDHDPKAAVGDLWEELGQLQFDYLLGKGLNRSDRMLDIGCGTLRAGRLFIPWLDRGGYTGTDISQRALAYGEQLIQEEGLQDKAATLVLEADLKLRFEEFDDGAFDVVLAQSVFTHLHQPEIEECFAHIGRIMAPNARFFFTFVHADEPTQRNRMTFSYPFEWLQEVAARGGLKATRLFDYPHPRAMQMAVAEHG